MLIYLFFGLLLFVAVLFCGSVLSSFLLVPDSEKKGNDILFKLLVGTILVATVYAVIRTQFNSVFILFVSVFFLSKRQKLRLSFALNDFKYAGIFILYFLLTFGWQYLYQSTNAFIFNHDQIYYSMLANMLSTNGVETVYVHPVLNLGFYGNTPYHYLELWLTALFKTVSNVPCDYTLVFVVIPFFSALSCYSLHVNFGEKLRLNIYLKVLLFFAILHCSPLSHELFHWLPKIGQVIQSLTINPFISSVGFKLLVSLPFVVYIYSLKDEKDKRTLIVFSFFLLIINFAVGVCFWISLGIYIFYKLISGHKNNKSEILYFLIFTCLYGGFYFITGSKFYNNLDFWYALSGNLSDFRVRINILGGVGIAVIFLILFYLFLIKIFTNRFLVPEKDLVIFISLIIATGALLWALFYNIIDAIQFCNNAICIIHIIFWFTIVYYIMQSANYVSVLFFGFLLVFIFVLPLFKTSRQEMTDEFVRKDICNRLSQIGFLGLDSNLIKSDPFVNNSELNYNLHHAYSRPGSYYTCSPEMLFKKHSKIRIDSSNQFQRQIEDLLMYYKLKSPQTKNMSDDQIIISFAKKYNVNHIYLKPGEKIPVVLKPYVSEKISIGKTDSLLFFKVPE